MFTLSYKFALIPSDSFNRVTMKIKSFEKKLMAYSASALGIIASTQNADAQILYTDLHEDRQFGDTASFIFDLNYDNFHDLMIFQAFSANAQLILLQRAHDTEILGQSQGNYMYPLALSANYQLDTINKNWKIRDIGTMNFQGANAYGNWQGVTDKYVGIKIKIKGKPHFGWARLDVAQNAKSFIVKDYAFEFTPYKPIKTGEGMNTYGITAITGESANNGKAIKIRFNKAFDESKVSSYRIFFKKETDTSQFTPQMALNLSPSRYIIRNKTGNNHEFFVDGTNVDISGNAMKSGVNYQVWVLSMPDGVIAVDPILSTNKKYFSFEDEAGPAGKPMASDIANNGNGLDVEVRFTKADDESKIAVYKVIVCKSDKAAALTVEDAKKLKPTRTTDVSKTGSDLTVVLTAAIEDSDGEKIKNNVKYKVVVVSVADGVKASKNKISQPSDEFELINTSGIKANDDQNFSIFQQSGKIKIVLNKSIGNSYFELISQQGQIVLKKQFNESENIEFETNDLPEGVYFFRIRNDHNLFSGKLLL